MAGIQSCVHHQCAVARLFLIRGFLEAVLMWHALTAVFWSPHRSSFRLWQQSEVSDDISSQLPANPVADTFARLMTGLYAKLQSDAGEIYVAFPHTFPLNIPYR